MRLNNFKRKKLVYKRSKLYYVRHKLNKASRVISLIFWCFIKKFLYLWVFE